MLESRMRRRSLSFPVNCWREDFPTASTTAHEYSGFPFSPPLQGYLKIFELQLGMIKYIYEPPPMNIWGTLGKQIKRLIVFQCGFICANFSYLFHTASPRGPGKSQHNCQSVKTLRFSATKLLSPKVCNTCENGNGLQTKHDSLF